MLEGGWTTRWGWKQQGRRVGSLLSGPQQHGRMRERLVTGGDAALIALSWFHAHFREAAVTAPT